MRKTSNEELGRVSLNAYKRVEKMPVVVVLDNVRSMHNVGAAFRTADAFTVSEIILTGITAQPPHRDIHKTALGATESVAWRYVAKTIDAVRMLREEGYEIIVVEQATPHTSLEDFDVSSGKYALVFGNEVFGVEEEVVSMADRCLEIPQHGTKHSLNISVSIGIVLWKMFSSLKLSH